MKTYHFNNLEYVIFFLSLLCFLFGLSHEFIGFDSRFALFAREMFQHGFTWFPTTYGKPYPDYPVTQTLLITLFSYLTDSVTTLSGVLPSAIAASITLFFTYRIGALHSKEWGIYAVILLLLTNTFFTAARGLSVDQIITAISTFSFYYVYRSWLAKEGTKLSFILLLLSAGFACRGAIGLVIPAAILMCFYLINRDYRQLVILSISSSVLLILSFMGLFVAAYFSGGEAFVKEVWYMQVAGRMHDLGDTRWYFYLTRAFGDYAISFPLACMVILGTIPQLKNYKKDQRMHFLVVLIAWLMVILVGMSIPTQKKTRYILASAPAMSLLAAYLFIERPPIPWLDYVKKFVLVLLGLLPLLSVIGIVAGQHILAQHNIVLRQSTSTAVIILSLLTLVTLYLTFQRRLARPLFISLVGLISFITIQLMVIEPIAYQLEMTTPFISKVDAVKKPDQDIVFFRLGPDSMDIKYVVNSPKLFNPVFLRSAVQVFTYPKHAIFITSEEELSQQPADFVSKIHITARGNIGHKKCLAFVVAT